MGSTEKGDDVVNFYGWGGSMLTNRWIDGTLSDIAQEKYGIKVNRVGMDIDDILNLLIAEKAAGKQDGSVDLVWINGENFYTARKTVPLSGDTIPEIILSKVLLPQPEVPSNTVNSLLSTVKSRFSITVIPLYVFVIFCNSSINCSKSFFI